MADEAMTKARFLKTMRAERRQWEETITAVGEERMTLPGFAGVWSVRDVVAHITAYERWLLERLEAAARGEEAAPSVLDDGDMERRNLAAHELTRGLSLAEVQAEAQRVWSGLMKVAERASEAELIEPRSRAGVRQAPLGQRYPPLARNRQPDLRALRGTLARLPRLGWRDGFSFRELTASDATARGPSQPIPRRVNPQRSPHGGNPEPAWGLRCARLWSRRPPARPGRGAAGSLR